MLHSLQRGCAPQTGFTHASQTPSWPPIVAEAQPAALTQPAEPAGLGPGSPWSRGLTWSFGLLQREKRVGKFSSSPPLGSGSSPSSAGLHGEYGLAEDGWAKSREACRNPDATARAFTTSRTEAYSSSAHTACWSRARTHTPPQRKYRQRLQVKYTGKI